MKDDRRTTILFRWSISVFFIGDFLTAFVSLLVPRMTLVLGLGDHQTMLVNLAFSSKYLVFAGVGWRSYPLTPQASALLSMGITFLQIASNTVVTVTGDPPRRAPIAAPEKAISATTILTWRWRRPRSYRTCRARLTRP